MRELYTDSEWNESDQILHKDIKIINNEIRINKLKIIRGLDKDDGKNYYMLVNHCKNSESCWKTLNVWHENFTDSEKDKLQQIATNIMKTEYRKIT